MCHGAPTVLGATADAARTDTAAMQDLVELGQLWPRLPEAVRAGFLATARALAGGEGKADA